MKTHYDIQIDDLPEDLRQMADLIGFEAVLALVRARGGESIYLPKLERIAASARNRAILAEFDGANHRELARKYGLTVTWVREILGMNRKEKQKPFAKQMRMF